MSAATVRIRRLPHGAGMPLPAYKSTGAAGCDLAAAVPADAPLVVPPGGRTLVPTGIAILLYLTRRLGPATYGQYATVMTVVLWIEMAITSLLNRAIIKLVAQAEMPREAASGMIQRAAAISACGTVLLWLLAGPLSRALGDASLAPLFALASVDIVLFVTGAAYTSAIAGLATMTSCAVETCSTPTIEINW